MTKPEKVQLFVTCMIEALRPEAGLAVVSVLESLGIEVIVPEGQTCCGQIGPRPSTGVSLHGYADRLPQ